MKGQLIVVGCLVMFVPALAVAELWIEHTVDSYFDKANSVYATDLDGDGDKDVLGAAMLANDITWWENIDGTGTSWTEHTIDSDFDRAYSVYAEDVDGDGDIDVLGAANGADDITWWENTDGTGGVWTEHTVDGEFDGAASVYAADVDGDGDTDILGAASLADDITWWENVEGTGTSWTEHTVDSDVDRAYSVHATDVDGDGDIDVLGAAIYADDIIWWENLDGTGTSWAEHNVDSDFVEAASVYATDMDGDGDTDILGAGGYSFTWWENLDGTGTSLIEHIVDSNVVGGLSVYATDVDNDGDTDILGAAAGYTNDIIWWENTDSMGTSWTKHTVDGDFGGAASVYATDVDGDGDTDVLGAGWDDLVTWWEQVNVLSISPTSSLDLPADGGQLIYDVQYESPFPDHDLLLSYFTFVQLPNGEEIGPLFVQQFQNRPYAYAEGLTQDVPAYAPAGDYTFQAYVQRVDIPNQLVYDQFTFTKEGAVASIEAFVFDPHDWLTGGGFLLAENTSSPSVQVPSEYEVYDPYPNPFNPTTTLALSIPEAANVTVRAFNVLGQQVATLTDGRLSAGHHSLTFDATNLTSGVYFIHTSVPGQLADVQKVLLVR
jgi:FG-GAP-like repeat/Secretion system C-terminal sorting domain